MTVALCGLLRENSRPGGWTSPGSLADGNCAYFSPRSSEEEPRLYSACWKIDHVVSNPVKSLRKCDRRGAGAVSQRLVIGSESHARGGSHKT